MESSSFCGIYVNLDEVRGLMQDLAAMSNVFIRDLKVKYPIAYQKYQRLLAIISEVENSDAYGQIWTIMDQETRGIVKIIPGTIGAYFKGCLLADVNSGEPACSELCLNGAQPPNKEGWNKCDQTIVHAEWDEAQGCFQFNHKHVGGNVGQIYVEYDNLRSFPGFSESEKQALKFYGISSCKLLGTGNGINRRDLLGGYHAVDNLPSRVVQNGQGLITGTSTNTSGGFGAGTFAGAFLLILLIILIIYWISSSKPRPATPMIFRPRW